MNEKGRHAEDVAVWFLKKQGYKIIERNFSSYFGEIDIIAEDKRTVVFVEVKFRKKNSFGGGAAAVTPSKQLKIKKTAQIYLQKMKVEPNVRFDVLVITGDEENMKKAQIEIIKDAFR